MAKKKNENNLRQTFFKLVTHKKALILTHFFNMQFFNSEKLSLQKTAELLQNASLKRRFRHKIRKNRTFSELCVFPYCNSRGLML